MIDTNIRRTTALFLAFYMLMQLVYSSWAGVGYSEALPRARSDVGYLKVQEVQDRSKAESGEELLWELLYNEAEQKRDAGSIRITLSEGQILQSLLAAGPQVESIFLVETIDRKEQLKPIWERPQENDADSKLPPLDLTEQLPIEIPAQNEAQTYVINVAETDKKQNLILKTELTVKAGTEFTLTAMRNDSEGEVQAEAKQSVPSRGTIDVRAKVLWRDVPADIKVPEVTLQLVDLATHIVVAEQIVPSGTADVIFQNIKNYDDQGNRLEFAVIQKPIEGYDTSFDKDTVTNRYKAEESKKTEPDGAKSAATDSTAAESMADLTSKANEPAVSSSTTIDPSTIKDSATIHEGIKTEEVSAPPYLSTQEVQTAELIEKIEQESIITAPAETVLTETLTPKGSFTIVEQEPKLATDPEKMQAYKDLILTTQLENVVNATPAEVMLQQQTASATEKTVTIFNPDGTVTVQSTDPYAKEETQSTSAATDSIQPPILEADATETEPMAPVAEESQAERAAILPTGEKPVTEAPMTASESTTTGESILAAESLIAAMSEEPLAAPAQMMLDSAMMAQMALGTATAQTYTGSGTIVSSMGSYTWQGTISATGDYIDWVITVRATGSSDKRAVLFIPTDANMPLTTSSISATGSNGTPTIQMIADGSGTRVYSANGTNNPITLTVNFRTTMASSTTIVDFTRQFTPYVRMQGTGNAAYGPSNSSSGAFGAIETALTKVTVTIPNNLYSPITDVTINKVDSVNNNIKLLGAVFTLTPGGQTATTNANGIATFTGVTAGSYTITETTPPAGYTGGAPQTVNISATNNTFTFQNTLIPYLIQIESKDQNGSGIVGAGYTVWNMTINQKVGDFTTGPGGVVTTGQLVAGNHYTVTQNNVPVGYASTATSPVTINNLQPGTTKASFINNANTYSAVTINLKKTDTTENLEGGVFEIWTTGANPVRVAGPGTTAANGNIVFSVLNGSVYEVRQITAPTGYTAASPQTLDLSAVNQTGSTNVQFYNSDVTLTVNVKAQGTSTNLAGAVFVAKVDGNVISTSLPSDAGGNTVLSGLAVGTTYTIEEITPPVGYMPISPQTVTMNTQTQSLNVTNVPLKLTLTLTSPYDVPIDATEFALKDAAGNVITTGTTSAQGQIVWTGAPLVYGAIYTVEQTTVKAGHKKADPQQVTVNSANGTVNFTNGQFASLNITLYQTGTTTPISGASFVVKDGSGNTVGGPATTGTDGKVTITGLEDGKNYFIEQLYAPGGYVPIQPKAYKQDGLTYNQTLFNSQGTVNTSSIKISVVDKDNANLKLQGAEFRATGPTGINYYVTTNSEGIATLSNLPNGEYTIVQTKAPGGYLVEPKTVTQTLNNQLGELTVQNIKTGTTLQPGIIKTTIYETGTTTPIANATIRATDNLGNTYYATSDANGVLYFSGLDVTKSYNLEIAAAPYVYGPGPIWPGAQLGIGFIDPTTPFYRETIFYLDRAPVETIIINVYEKGDVRVKIPSAVVELTYPDGTKKNFTTNANGYIQVDNLTNGFMYKVRQLTTDSLHLIDPIEQTVYLLRTETVDFENPLKDVTSIKKDISVTKIWGDPKPTNVTSVIFTLYADGASTGLTRSIAGGTGTATFSGQRKYDDNHSMIKYTVVETPIPDYYVVYTRTQTDGYAWTATNYEGKMIGQCSTGTWWMSDSSTATEFNPNGTKTGTTIELGTTFGYGIALTPTAMSDGIQYLFGLNVDGRLTMHDVGKPKNQTHVSTSTTKLVAGYTSNDLDYANSLGISNDGKWLFAAGEQDQTIKIFSTEAVITWMKAGGNTPPPASMTISVAGISNATGFAGDIVQLPNGDLLVSVNNNNNKGYGSGLVIFPKIGDPAAATWGTPKRVGNLAFPTSGTDERIEALGLIYPSGVTGPPKIVVQQYSSATGRTTYTLNDFPSHNDNNKTYALTQFGTPLGSKVADATSMSSVGCTAEVKVVGSKTWIGDNPDFRPTKIRVELNRNGNPTGTYQDIGQDEFGNWTWTFENLPKFDSNGTSYKYTTKEIGYLIGTAYYPGTPPGYTTTYPEGTTPDYSITNTLVLKEVVLYKTNGTDINKPLAGAVFQLYAEDKTTAIGSPVVTGADGKIDLGTLSSGQYWLKEIIPPEGFVPDEHLRSLIIRANGTVELEGQTNPPLIIPNYTEKPTEIGLQKVDQDLDAVSGASFKIEKTSGEGTYNGDSAAYVPYQDPDSGITERFGVFRDLTAGTYRIWEARNPIGYIRTDVYYTFEVVKDSTTGNTVDSIAWIRKHTGPTDTTGTVIYNPTAVPPVKTGDIVSLPYNNAQIIGLQVINEPNKIEFEKRDATGINPLAGAIFGLYIIDNTYGTLHTLADGTRVKLRQVTVDGTPTPVQATSGEDGKFSFTKLAAGTYYVKEEEAPAGYSKIPHPIGPYVITDKGLEGVTNPIEITNQKIELPMTGSIGGEIFIAGRLLLMLAATQAYRRLLLEPVPVTGTKPVQKKQRRKREADEEDEVLRE